MVAISERRARVRALLTENEVSSQQELLALLAADGVDRKSTRLNSSHVVISYAVFCLKKKKLLTYIHYLIHL